MSENSVQTSHILMSNFIKYRKLSELISIAFSNSEATSINLYIDLYSMCKTLFSDSYRTDISNYTAMASSILNMCGHYREFFDDIGVHTRIFLIFSYNTLDIYRRLVPEYNSKFLAKSQNQLIRKMVDENTELLGLVCKLIYDIYFLKTEFEPASMIDYLINKGDGNPNIILSKDIYPSQLTYLHANTVQIKPKKLNGEDISVIIPTYENPLYIDSFWSVFCSRDKILRSNITINPINFTLLAAMNRLPERNLRTLMNIQTANRIIYRVTGDQPIKLTVDSLRSFGDPPGTSLQDIDNRQHALDVEFFRELYDNSIESKTISFENINDPGTLNAICADAFRLDPVDLTRL